MASYSGDANNASIARSSCDDPLETVVVQALPMIEVTQVASTVGAPDWRVTFTVTVNNPSASIPVTTTSLGSDRYGKPRDPSRLDLRQPDRGHPGRRATSPACTYTAVVRGLPGKQVTSTVTVVGTDANSATASDTVQTTVTLQPRRGPTAE